MKIKKIFYSTLTLAFAGMTLTSCNDFLDKMPDNRATIDTDDKAISLLTSAYPENDYMMVGEFMSDNVDDYGANNPYTDRFIDQVYHWQDVTEDNNESPEEFWQASYKAIANANQALASIEEMGADKSAKLSRAKGEALLCRAYNHFMLTNMFCKNYNDTTSNKDLGIPYMEGPETTLYPKYSRGTVAEDYEKIEKDLLEGLSLVGDADYKVPKYHFNVKAAYAFACRFYLYYEKWDKAIQYADLLLGPDAKSQLRDWSQVATMTTSFDAESQHYIDVNLNANLLLLTAYSSLPLATGPYRYYTRYSHGNYLAQNEDCKASNLWGSYIYFYSRPHTYSATNLDRVIFYKLPYLFEYTDPVAGIGYRHTVYPAFTTDEALLNRAEAYVMLKQYDKAAEDLNTWMHNITRSTTQLTPEKITTFYNSKAYSYDDEAKIASTIKKHLHPAFKIDAEGSTQECMLQAVLGFRRIETLQTGLRWFDIKRYGIEIVRRVIGADGKPAKLVDVLKVNDPRRAVQIPSKVVAAGLEANPR